MSTLAEKCSRPVTLSKTLVDVRTGEATDGGTFQKACGTRLASRCPSCSEVYRRDLMTVIGEGLDEVKGEKVIAYKYKKRKNYRRKVGHRQKYSKVKITDIQLA